MENSATQGWHHKSQNCEICLYSFLSDSTVDLPLYNGLLLNTIISVSDAVNTHLLKVGGLGF